MQKKNNRSFENAVVLKSFGENEVAVWTKLYIYKRGKKLVIV